MGKRKGARASGATKPGSDFAKAKRAKLGKATKAAANATDTTVRSKRVVVPNQRTLVTPSKETGKTSEPDHATGSVEPCIPGKNVTLTDLLRKLSHPSAPTRRDGISAVRSLLMAEQSRAISWIGRALERTIPMTEDLDSRVRHAVRALLCDTVRVLGPHCVLPFLRVLTVKLASGLANVDMDVRLDTLRLYAALVTAKFSAPSPLSSADASLDFDRARLDPLVDAIVASSQGEDAIILSNKKRVQLDEIVRSLRQAAEDKRAAVSKPPITPISISLCEPHSSTPSILMVYKQSR